MFEKFFLIICSNLSLVLRPIVIVKIDKIYNLYNTLSPGKTQLRYNG